MITLLSRHIFTFITYPLIHCHSLNIKQPEIMYAGVAV